MVMLTSTRVFRPGPDKLLLNMDIVTSSKVLAVAAVISASAVAPVQAQSLPSDLMLSSTPAQGHSAVHYGLTEIPQQEASIRSVLSSVQLDRPYLQPSLVAESSYFLVQMLLGGGGAPSDIADPRQDVGKRLQRE